MLGPRTRSDPATPTGASPGARPPRPRSNRESDSNEPGVRADTVRPAPQRPRCLRAEPGPSVLPTMQDPLTTSRPSRGRPTCIDARSGANGATLTAQFAYRVRGAHGAGRRWRVLQHRARHSESVICFGPAAAFVAVANNSPVCWIVQESGFAAVRKQGHSYTSGTELDGDDPMSASPSSDFGARRPARWPAPPGSDGRFSAVTASRARRGPYFRGRRRLHGGVDHPGRERRFAGRKLRWRAI